MYSIVIQGFVRLCWNGSANFTTAGKSEQQDCINFRKQLSKTVKNHKCFSRHSFSQTHDFEWHLCFKAGRGLIQNDEYSRWSITSKCKKKFFKVFKFIHENHCQIIHSLSLTRIETVMEQEILVRKHYDAKSKNSISKQLTVAILNFFPLFFLYCMFVRLLFYSFQQLWKEKARNFVWFTCFVFISLLFFFSSTVHTFCCLLSESTTCVLEMVEKDSICLSLCLRKSINQTVLSNKITCG